MQVRLAEPRDLETLIKARFDYFAAESWVISPEDRETILAQLTDYYTKRLNDSFFAALVEDEDGKLACTAYLAVREMPSNPMFPTGKAGTVLNVLTYPEYRRQGCATMAMRLLIEVAKRENLTSMDLSASDMGRPLYEKLGFTIAAPSKFASMKLNLL